MEPLELPRISALLLRMGAAAVLAAAIAFRPWMGRRWGRRGSAAQKQTQTLIAVAAALTVTVVGDSTARAFGLVGLGAFIRFRSGLKDPQDAAAMFMAIGIGMAAGLGAIWLAVSATAFFAAVLLVFDLRGSGGLRLVVVRVDAPQPLVVAGALAAAYPGARVMEVGEGAGLVRAELCLPENSDAREVQARLQSQGITGIRSVALDPGKNS